MGTPITTTAPGICFAFPDVCVTPAAPSPVPIPYPNTGKLQDAQGATNVRAGGNFVVLRTSTISNTTGDEAGSNSPTRGPVSFTTSSNTVRANRQGIVRMFDTTRQNGGNAVGTVLGGVATVLVGD